tara:strand:+ start:126 stop:410 length:285 start_codon:yes stop_codon:yes gene_type:complete
MPHITLVKKILADGHPCAKCLQVEKRLETAGLMLHINDIVVADERVSDSPGIKLAEKHGVEQAPFFIVSDGDQNPVETVYTVYFKFVKAVFGSG